MSNPPSPTGTTNEQRVTWAELFFDLGWVFALTQIAALFAASHGVDEAASALLLLAPLWWGWVGVTMLGNAWGSGWDGPRGRLVLFILAACGLVMAVAIPGAYERYGLVFAGAYFVLRLVLWAAMRRLPLFGGLRVEPFAASLLVSGPLFLLGGIVTGPWRAGAWAVAALVEVLIPVVLGRRLDGMRFETSHLPERFGLFVIIALGETVVAVGTQTAAQAGPAALLTLPLTFTLIVGLWWTYFHFGASAVKHSLEADPVQNRIVREVFSYGHFVYALALVCIAVGLKKLVAHPLSAPHELPELLLAPGVGLYLLGFCYARWRMFGAALVPRFAGAFTCFAVAATAPLLPSFVIGLLVVAVLAAVNTVEWWIVTTGRQLPVVRVPALLRRVR